MSSSSPPPPPAAHPNGGANASPAPIDALYLQNLMSRMQLRAPFLDTNSYLTSSLDDFLLSDLLAAAAASDDDESDDGISSLVDDLADSDVEGDVFDEDDDEEERRRRMLAKEEAKLEKEIVRLVNSGSATSALRPNSGQSVAVGEHHVCVGFHEDPNGEYRVWEWHGHVMLFDDEEGYSAEYIYGNYFERLSGGVGVGGGNVFLGRKEATEKKSKSEEVEEEEEDEIEKDGSFGLRDLIIDDGSGSNGASSSVANGGARVVHRNHAVNAGSAAAASAAR